MSRRAARRKRRARKALRQPAPVPPAARPLDDLSRALRTALFVSLGLLLLTPFVVTAGTVFPFVVGKALWSRALIEIAFALWALLALRDPAYRPPHAWLLALAAAGLGVSALSAALGASAQYSLWTSYERMQGVVDQAHWVALAFVLASAVRGAGAWRVLLGAHAAAGTAVAFIVIAGAVGIEVPFYGGLPGQDGARAGGPFGNPTWLSVFMLANLGLCAAFCARARALASGPATVGWASLALLHLSGLVLAGSVGGFAGLLGAAAFAAFAFAWLARGRRRRVAVALLVLLAAGTATLGARFVDGEARGILPIDGPAAQWPGAAALRYVGRVDLQRPSVQSRLAAWEAGLEGFADRPLLGWGPGNFQAVFGLFGSGYAAASTPHDQAHGKLVEVAATTGLAGIAVWLLTWGLALAVPVLAARTLSGPDRAFAVFAAAALAGNLVQLQFLFDTPAGNLFATFLLAFAARLESRALPPAWRACLPARAKAPISRALRVLRRRGAAAALAAAAVTLALWGLAVNRAILAAADSRHVGSVAVPTFATAEGIEAFPPLAGTYRMFLFLELTRNWAAVRAADPAAASRLLAWADREADAAVASEPWNWRIEQTLAHLYRAVADTEPAYEARARRHLERTRLLAPAREPFPAPLQPPGDLLAMPATAGPGNAAAGAIELRWSPSPGAGYHQLARSTEPGRWTTLLYTYDAERQRFFASDCDGCRHRIRACRTRLDCSDWALWP
ncbi:MAG: O-antigen ligase family protein [Rhodospirillales bacterium]|nr:O-antigen ligase family protein [Rhodospirillales bacterium]